MISRMLLLDLKHAIKNKELYMLYQPQVYSDGICIGAEALLRWNGLSLMRLRMGLCRRVHNMIRILKFP